LLELLLFNLAVDTLLKVHTTISENYITVMKPHILRAIVYCCEPCNQLLSWFGLLGSWFLAAGLKTKGRHNCCYCYEYKRIVSKNCDKQVTCSFVQISYDLDSVVGGPRRLNIVLQITRIKPQDFLDRHITRRPDSC